MSGTKYYDRCPVHQSVLKTDRTKKFCLKKSGPIYDAPIFFCDKCKTYYVFIKELEVSFKGGATASDGYPIKVLGRKAVAKPAKEVKKTTLSPKNTNPSAKQKPAEAKKKQNKKGQIVRSIDDGVLTVNIVPTGTKVPKSCQKCGAATSNLIFKVVDISGKEKQLVGKECPSCGSIYYTESIVHQHPKCFRQAGATQKQKMLEIEETVESSVEEKAKNETAETSPTKPADNRQQKKKKKVFSTLCPEHDIVLRTPVMWKSGIPLFSCPQCEKYYVNSKLYPYGSVVERFRARPVINADLIVTSMPDPDRKENNVAEEKMDTENRASLEGAPDKKSASFSASMSTSNDRKESLGEKTGDQKAEKNENREQAERNNELSESQNELKRREVSQWRISEIESVLGRKTYTDDFGVEYDFSGLESVLML